MPADLFDGGIIEVTGVTEEAGANRVGVLQAIKDLRREGRLAALPQLKLACLLVGGVDTVKPHVML